MRLQTLPTQTAAPAARAALWPDGVTFREAIQNTQTVLEDPELRSAAVVQDRLGLPLIYSGRFAVVFRLRTRTGDWALRCFTQASAGGERRERYRALSETLAEFPRYFVPFRYIERGVRIAGEWYPVVAMRWAEGETLGRFVEANHGNPSALQALSAALRTLLGDLETAGIAHGDWQHDNLLVAEGGRRITLVDYDGMYVPALAGRAAPEVGHPNFQHPARSGAHYGVGLDRFACLTLQTALRALAHDPSLWTRFSDGESILFKRGDFADPNASPVFAALRDLARRGDPHFGACLDALHAACLAGPSGVLLPDDALPLPADFPQPPRATADVTADAFWSRKAALPPQATPGFLARVNSAETARAEREYIEALYARCHRMKMFLVTVPLASVLLGVVGPSPGRLNSLLDWFFALCTVLTSLAWSVWPIVLIARLVALNAGPSNWPRRKILSELEAAIGENKRILHEGYHVSEDGESCQVVKGILPELKEAYQSLNKLDALPHIDDRSAFVTAELGKAPVHRAPLPFLGGGDPLTLRRLRRNGVRTAADLSAQGPVPEVSPGVGNALLDWRDDLAAKADALFAAKNAERDRLRERIAELKQLQAENLLKQEALERERAAFPDASPKLFWKTFWGRA